MKAYRMTWRDKETAEAVVIIDCGITRAHSEAGVRKLYDTLELVDSQVLGEVSGYKEMETKWGKG